MTRLGFLKNTGYIIYPPRFQCTVLNVQYWDLVNWKRFQKANFFISKFKNKFTVNVRSQKKSNYEGHLVKLEIKCTKGNQNLQSCTVFKFLGKREYAATIGTPTKPSTKPRTKSSKPKATPKTKEFTIKTTSTKARKEMSRGKTEKNNMLILIIIVVAGVLSLLVVVIVIWCCCRKRKSRRNQNHGTATLLSHGEDPNYQNPNNLPGRHSTEVNECKQSHLFASC